MLIGIVKFDGTVADLDKDMNDTLRASSRRCFEAGFLYGVNKNGSTIKFDPEIKTEIFVKDADQPAAEPKPAAEPEPAAEQPEQPAEPVEPAKPGRSGGAGDGSK